MNKKVVIITPRHGLVHNITANKEVFLAVPSTRLQVYQRILIHVLFWYDVLDQKVLQMLLHCRQIHRFLVLSGNYDGVHANRRHIPVDGIVLACDLDDGVLMVEER